MDCTFLLVLELHPQSPAAAKLNGTKLSPVGGGGGVHLLILELLLLQLKSYRLSLLLLGIPTGYQFGYLVL